MPKVSFILLAGVPLAISLVFSPSLIAQTKSADSFDAPLKKTVLDFGPPPDFLEGNGPVKVTCYFYRPFVVKEYDGGGLASQWHEIIPVSNGVVPVCTQNAGAGKMLSDDAGGYFKGVKGNLVFINAYDGFDGGLGFSVHDSTTGKKIFEDSVHEPSTSNEEMEVSPFDRLRFSTAQDGRLHLRYLRVTWAGCDLNLEKDSCWEKAGKMLGLKSAQMPVCSEYGGTSESMASVIAYPLEVIFSPHPTIKAIAGPVKCWPVD